MPARSDVGRKRQQAILEIVRTKPVARQTQLVELLRARGIDATQSTLNAVVALRDRDQVLQDARAAEERIACGEARPLEGIPLGVKDLENVAGMVTSHGSVLFKDAVAKRDDVIQGSFNRDQGCETCRWIILLAWDRMAVAFPPRLQCCRNPLKLERNGRELAGPHAHG